MYANRHYVDGECLYFEEGGQEVDEFAVFQARAMGLESEYLQQIAARDDRAGGDNPDSTVLEDSLSNAGCTGRRKMTSERRGREEREKGDRHGRMGRQAKDKESEVCVTGSEAKRQGCDNILSNHDRSFSGGNERNEGGGRTRARRSESGRERTSSHRIQMDYDDNRNTTTDQRGTNYSDHANNNNNSNNAIREAHQNHDLSHSLKSLQRTRTLPSRRDRRGGGGPRRGPEGEEGAGGERVRGEEQREKRPVVRSRSGCLEGGARQSADSYSHLSPPGQDDLGHSSDRSNNSSFRSSLSRSKTTGFTKESHCSAGGLLHVRPTEEEQGSGEVDEEGRGEASCRTVVRVRSFQSTKSGNLINRGDSVKVKVKRSIRSSHSDSCAFSAIGGGQNGYAKSQLASHSLAPPGSPLAKRNSEGSNMVDGDAVADEGIHQGLRVAHSACMLTAQNEEEREGAMKPEKAGEPAGKGWMMKNQGSQVICNTNANNKNNIDGDAVIITTLYSSQTLNNDGGKATCNSPPWLDKEACSATIDDQSLTQPRAPDSASQYQQQCHCEHQQQPDHHNNYHLQQHHQLYNYQQQQQHPQRLEQHEQQHHQLVEQQLQQQQLQQHEIAQQLQQITPRRLAKISVSRAAQPLTDDDLGTIYRVVVLGSSSVGKTTLTEQLLTSEYLPNSVGNDQDDDGCAEKIVSVELDDEQSLLQFIDHPGSSAATAAGDRKTSHGTGKSYNKNTTGTSGCSIKDTHGKDMMMGSADAYLVVYSVSDRGSFLFAQSCLHDLRPAKRRNAVILVANKQDIVRNRNVTEDEGRSVATKRQCKFIEVSALLDLRVDELLVGVTRQIRLRQPNRYRSTATGGGGGRGEGRAGGYGADPGVQPSRHVILLDFIRRFLSRAGRHLFRRRRLMESKCDDLYTA